MRQHSIDPETRIWPIPERGAACARGFVRDSRFQRSTEAVIPGTDRAKSRKWLAIDRRDKKQEDLCPSGS